jgi:hypothetical protein
MAINGLEADCNQKPGFGFGDIGNIKGDQFRTPERTGKALCVPKIRFGVDAASGRRKLAS